MVDDNAGKPPSRQRPGAPSRLWMTVAVVIVILVNLSGIIGFELYKFSTNLHATLHTQMSAVFGRNVTLSAPSLSRTLWIDEITVDGDGVIDTGPVLVLRGVRVWPNLWSLLTFAPKADRCTVESAVVHIRQSDEQGWSVRGLFPLPPTKEPTIRTIAMPHAEITIDYNGNLIRRDVNILLNRESYGDYDIVFSGAQMNGTLSHVGNQTGHPVASLKMAFESIPILGGTERIEIATDYLEESRIVNFDVATVIKGTSGRLTGSLSFDSNSAKSDSAVWKYGEHAGCLSAHVDDFARKRFTLASEGALACDARSLGGGFDTGTVFVDRISIVGGLRGIWDIRGAIRVKGLSSKTVLNFSDLSGEAELSASLSDNFKFTPAHLKGSARFGKLQIGNEALSNGDLKFDATTEAVILDGRADAFGGRLASRNLQINLGADMAPISAEGPLNLKDVDGRTLNLHAGDISIAALTADLKAFSMRRAPAPGPGGDAWKVMRAEGVIDHATGSLAGSPVAATRAEIDLVNNGDNRFDGQFNGGINIFGGSGLVKASIKSNEMVNANFKLNSLDIDSIRRYRDNPFFARLAGHLQAFDIEGSVDFADTGTIDIGEATLTLDGGKTRLSIPRTLVTGEIFATRVTIQRLDAGRARDVAQILYPNRYTDKLNVSGAIVGWADLDKRGDSISAEIDISGNIRLKETPFEFHAQGNVSDVAPNLIMDIKTFSLPALHSTMADIDDRIDPKLMTWEGTGGAKLTLVGTNWSDVNIDGVLKMHDASVKFNTHDLRFHGLSGEIPFRLQRAKLLEVGPLDSRRVTCDRMEWADLVVNDLTARTRFSVIEARDSEKALYFDDMTYKFADGSGRGAFAMYFPTWEHPKTAFFGDIRGCSVGIIYRTMQPFKGKLDGRASGRIEELTMENTDLRTLKASFHIENGIMGAELLTNVIHEMAPSHTREALMSLTEWNFDSGTLSLNFDPSYYSLETARSKFGSDRRDEILGFIDISGPARGGKRQSPNMNPDWSPPVGAAVDQFNPLNMFLSLLKIRLEVVNIQMRLLMGRVGKRLK